MRKVALNRNCSSRVMLVMAEELEMFEMGAMLRGHDVGGLGRSRSRGWQLLLGNLLYPFHMNSLVLDNHRDYYDMFESKVIAISS